jgi:hypothetical protein
MPANSHAVFRVSPAEVKVCDTQIGSLSTGAREVFQNKGASGPASRMLLQGLLNTKTAPAARSWRPRANLFAGDSREVWYLPAWMQCACTCGRIATITCGQLAQWDVDANHSGRPADNLTFVGRAGFLKVRDDCLRRN